ncbi:MAG: phosphopantetheine-binding protein, partial [Psychrosphaera sp.]|nr:phosphopantetheine-binding protein [Psychrosphaera sp.]
MYWRADGQLVYLGRDDGQIKLRGYRIELGEIEQRLSEHPAVKVAVVVFDQQPGNDRLLGYVGVGVSADKLDCDLRGWLQQQLPAHMVPAFITVMDELPLNSSGKIDRKALPQPDLSTDAPLALKTGNALEQQMVNIWQQLLQLERVSINDSFFDIGGHSLLLRELKTRLDEILDQPVALVSLFQYPTIAGLAEFVSVEPEARADLNAQPIAARERMMTHEDIAIVGMAGRFPGAADVDQFWANIRDGVSSIHRYTDEELLEQGIEPELFNQTDYVRAGGRLADCEMFDCRFFAYTPNEALVIDPQQRLLLESAYSAIENAGLDVQRLDDSVGKRVGVFAGVGSQTYFDRYVKPDAAVMARQGEYQLMLANDKDFVATRIAYKLGLKGPAINVQSACSTSLVAVHMACQSLRLGECDMALAGGAGVSFPQQGYVYKPGMIVSPDGHCRAFDAEAQGTVVGGGVATVVLMPLSKAKAKRLPIHAVIKGSAVNNDGNDKVGFTAPGVNGQAEVINTAMGALDVESVSYIEAHGTATPMGDPIEVAALTQAYRRHTKKSGYCAMGSVKSNICHLDVAAGIAGL